MSISDEIMRLKNAKENIKTAIANKGVEVSDSLTISDYAELINGISQENKDFIKGLFEHTMTELIIPDYVTNIGKYAFKECRNLISLTMPNSVTSVGFQAFFYCLELADVKLSANLEAVGDSAFATCSKLNTVTIPYGIKIISPSAFSQCGGLPYIFLPKSVTEIGSYSFLNCSSLTTINIPSGIMSINNTAFNGCTNLEFVTIESGFNCNGLNLSASTKFSVETIISWLEALADRTGLSTYTLTIGTTNLAKLTEEQIAIATAKNWTLA